MKLTFTYEPEKDIWCLLTYGKTSSNSSEPTKIYEALLVESNNKPEETVASRFIEDYLSKTNIHVLEYVTKYQSNWDRVAHEFQKKAENIFGVSLTNNVTAYLTVNTRCPYDIYGNIFFVSFSAYSAQKTAMHELWHFYTWYKFGVVWEKKLGKQKYNDLKEALTVLLNVECKDILPEGVYDGGYPQHKELRENILTFWQEERNMEKLWAHLVTL